MANAHADHAHDGSHHGGHDKDIYFVPHGSRWPVFASVALFTTMVGFASWLNEVSWGRTVFFVGLAALLAILFNWFRDVIANRAPAATTSRSTPRSAWAWCGSSSPR